MADFILHHYPGSPFSEKIRLILGAKRMAWKSVLVPVIMPKPDVVALTGGYRRTPFLQVGADIYCDSALIAQTIEAHTPTLTLYPAAYAGTAQALAHWADSFLFQASVATIFQPKNLSEMFNSPVELEAFVKDRSAMSQNAKIRRLRAPEAKVVIRTFLAGAEKQFNDGRQYLLGNELTIADFSTYHVLWFLKRASEPARILEPFVNVLHWMQRIAAFGHGDATELSSEEAVRIAHQAQPLALQHACDAEDMQIGDAVEVVTTDYVGEPVKGQLLVCNAKEIALRRADARAGEVTVHFPRVNYEVRKSE